MIYKFRALDCNAQNKEWVYGNPVLSESRREAYMVTYDEYTDKEFHKRKVCPETISRYSYVNDKNGNEIYEGDIVKYTFINPVTMEKTEKEYYVQQTNGKGFELYDEWSGDTFPLNIIRPCSLEVTGNIYERKQTL